MATLRSFQTDGNFDTPIIILNSDGDEVNFTIDGYNDDDEAFVITLEEYSVGSPAHAPSGQVITVTAPEGVEVNIVRQGTAEDSDD